ncbi:MAG: hypothetical protein KBT46_01565 [Ruminococcus sp.]|nr:hypothetical protein [Candidatus Copronaster equi]
MKHIKLSKRLISVLLSFSVIISIIAMTGITASAASYPSITLNVPRISQRPNTGDCAIASISSVEAYMYGYPNGNYNSEVYQAVYAKNGYTICAYWGTLGYERTSFNLATIYNQLRSGYPVIAHRTSNHYSVIYGYTGSTTNLTTSGFLIEDVDDSYSDTSAKKTLDKWAGGASLDALVIRKNGVSIPQSKIKITCNHPKNNQAKGETFSVCGNVVSKYNINSFHAYILDSNGYYAQNSNYEVNPNSKTYAISNCDSNMHFSKLTDGNYTYKIVATDTSGASAVYTYNFKVGNGSSEKKVSYFSRINNTSAELKSAADSSKSTLVNISKNTVVKITAECNGWGKTTYGGKTGWVQLSKCVNSLGDLNSDNKSNSDDALSILLYSTKKANFNSTQLTRADLDNDGKVNSADALYLLKLLTAK